MKKVENHCSRMTRPWIGQFEFARCNLDTPCCRNLCKFKKTHKIGTCCSTYMGMAKDVNAEDRLLRAEVSE